MDTFWERFKVPSSRRRPWQDVVDAAGRRRSNCHYEHSVQWDEPDHQLTSTRRSTADEAGLPDQLPFSKTDVVFVFFSIVTFFADVCTDLKLAHAYYMQKDLVFFGLTLGFFVISGVVSSAFSLYWYWYDYRAVRHGPSTLRVSSSAVWFLRCVFSLLLISPVLRYIDVIRYGLCSRRRNLTPEQRRAYFLEMQYERVDGGMLRLFECFLEDAPQLVLQFYIVLDSGLPTSSSQLTMTMVYQMAAMATSLLSLAWGLVAYHKALRYSRSDRRNLGHVGFAFLFMWRLFEVVPRVLAFAVFMHSFKYWLAVLIGCHWLVMAAWLLALGSKFCPTLRLELLFVLVIAAVWIFCHFNIKDGITRKRYLLYYAIVYIENSVMAIMWYVSVDVAPLSVQTHKDTLLPIILGSFWIGIIFMLAYYCFFHPNQNLPTCLPCSDWLTCREEVKNKHVANAPTKDLADGNFHDSPEKVLLLPLSELNIASKVRKLSGVIELSNCEPSSIAELSHLRTPHDTTVEDNSRRVSVSRPLPTLPISFVVPPSGCDENSYLLPLHEGYCCPEDMADATAPCHVVLSRTDDTLDLPSYMAPAPDDDVDLPSYVAPAPEDDMDLPSYMAPAPGDGLEVPCRCAPSPSRSAGHNSQLAPRDIPTYYAPDRPLSTTGATLLNSLPKCPLSAAAVAGSSSLPYDHTTLCEPIAAPRAPDKHLVADSPLNGNASGKLETTGSCVSSLENAGACVSSLENAGACVSSLDNADACASTLDNADACASTLDNADACASTLENAGACVSPRTATSHSVVRCAQDVQTCFGKSPSPEPMTCSGSEIGCTVPESSRMQDDVNNSGLQQSRAGAASWTPGDDSSYYNISAALLLTSSVRGVVDLLRAGADHSNSDSFACGDSLLHTPEACRVHAHSHCNHLTTPHSTNNDTDVLQTPERCRDHTHYHHQLTFSSAEGEMLTPDRELSAFKSKVSTD